MVHAQRLRLVVLISGRGSNLGALIDARINGATCCMLHNRGAQDTHKASQDDQPGCIRFDMVQQCQIKGFTFGIVKMIYYLAGNTVPACRIQPRSAMPVTDNRGDPNNSMRLERLSIAGKVITFDTECTDSGKA